MVEPSPVVAWLCRGTSTRVNQNGGRFCIRSASRTARANIPRAFCSHLNIEHLFRILRYTCASAGFCNLLNFTTKELLFLTGPPGAGLFLIWLFSQTPRCCCAVGSSISWPDCTKSLFEKPRLRNCCAYRFLYIRPCCSKVVKR